LGLSDKENRSLAFAQDDGCLCVRFWVKEAARTRRIRREGPRRLPFCGVHQLAPRTEFAGYLEGN
jgi:hypothetical protein